MLVRIKYQFHAKISLGFQQQRFEVDMNYCSMLPKVPEKMHVLHYTSI